MRIVLSLLLVWLLSPLSAAVWPCKAFAGGKVHLRETPKAGADLLAMVDTVCLGVVKGGVRQEKLMSGLFSKAAIGAVVSVQHKSWDGLRTAAVHLRADEDMTAKSAERLAGSPCVKALVENPRSMIAGIPDPREGELEWRAPIAHEGGERIFYHPLYGISQWAVIAVVDTGIQLDHPDLVSRMWSGPSGQRGFDFVNGDGDPEDDNGHGTHVAGLAGSQRENGIGVRGVMGSWSRLMAVKTQGPDGGGLLSDLVNGIRWAADHGAEVINISVSSKEPNAALEDAIEYAIAKSAMVVAAAGNDGQEITAANMYVPAGYAKDIAGVLAVGAFDALSLSRPIFSNFSPAYVEIAAPGAAGINRILSTFYQSRYIGLDGTSAAAPQVSGAAGLAIAFLKSHNRSYSPAGIEELLARSAVADLSLAPSFTGGRRLNVHRLGQLLLQSTVVDSCGGFDDE